jgi:hypothetical protein
MSALPSKAVIEDVEGSLRREYATNDTVRPLRRFASSG